MNKIRLSFIVAGATFLLASFNSHAQTSIQPITVSLVGEYQTNTFYTNASFPNGPWTSEYSFIRPVLVTTFNIMRAIALDLEGTNYAVWNGSQLVREVNLTDGKEGIFLRKGATQTNVSSFFGGSYSNNFMAELTNAFPALTNNISGLTNNLIESDTNIPQTLLFHGWLRRPDPTASTNATNQYVADSGIYFVSLNTTNIKFNLLGVGDGGVSHISGSVDGTTYETNINQEFLGTAGSYYLNTSTNIHELGTNPTVFVTGPMHGSFICGPATFAPITGP